MASTENLGLRFTRLLDANPEARADFEEMLEQFRQWRFDTMTMEPDTAKFHWLQGAVQQLNDLENFITACRARIVRETEPAS